MKTVKNKVRVEDIARVLNISPSSVSRALNDHPRISRKTKEKVKQTALKLGYLPGLPELMNPVKSEAVAVIVPSLKNNDYIEVLSGITDYFKESEYIPLIINTDGNRETVSSIAGSYRKYGICGVIEIVEDRNINIDYYTLLQKNSVPVITVFRPENDEKTDSVLPDVYQGVQKTVEHFKSLNVKRMTMILKSPDIPIDAQLAESFREVTESLDVDINGSSVIFTKEQNGTIGQLVKNIITKKPVPQAVMIKDMTAATEFAGYAGKYGLKIPDDLLLVAIGTELPASFLSGNISLLRIPYYKTGYASAEMLLYKLKNPHAERKVSILPVDLVLKSSAIRLK